MKIFSHPSKFPFAYYNEIDAHKAAWLRELIKRNVVADGIVDERSITEIHPQDLRGFTQHHFFAGIGAWSYALRNLAGWPDDRPVWTGSCPCPSFSAAGKGCGFNDPRHLWPDWQRLIRECKPATIFGEQADDAIGYGWLDLVQTDLERENYAVGKAVLGACSVGAPHIRQRLYFVAHSEIAETVTRPCQVSTRTGTHDANRFGIGGDNDRLEHTYSERRGEARRASSGSGERGQCASGSTADASNARRADAREHGSGQSLVSARPEQYGGTGDVADADGRGFAMHGTAQRETGQFERGSESGVDDSVGARLERHAGDGADGNESRWFGARPNGPASEAGHVNGFWRDADWILRKKWNSANFEWCPTEPGTFPLASGTPARVLRLRGYGDAICAPLAAEFIQAFQETQTLKSEIF